MAPNEELRGEALSGRRSQVTLSTKFGASRSRDGAWLGLKGNADYVRDSCDASLKRLRTDYIDLYFQHRVDPETPIEETVGAMAELVKAGKVRFIGLSEAGPDTIERAHRIHPVPPYRPNIRFGRGMWKRRFSRHSGALVSGLLPTARWDADS